MLDFDINYVLTNDLKERYVEVPVMPAAQKYFLAVSKSRDGYVRTRLDSLVGLALSIATGRDMYRKRKIRRKTPGRKIKIVLAWNLEHGKVNEETLVTLGKLLDKAFREGFCMYVRGAAKTGCSDNYAVNRFLDEFGITEEEWSVDTAKKAYRDYMAAAPGYEERNARLRNVTF